MVTNVTYHDEFQKIFSKIKDSGLKDRVRKIMEKIIDSPEKRKADAIPAERDKRAICSTFPRFLRLSGTGRYPCIPGIISQGRTISK